MQLTITEALARIHTISKRIEKKREFIEEHLARLQEIRDPLEKDGGAESIIQREQQAITDLLEQIIVIRLAVQKANQATLVTIAEQTRSIAEWLTWRKEVAPTLQKLTTSWTNRLSAFRNEAQRRGNKVFAGASAIASAGEAKAKDVVVNLNEVSLAKQREQLETALGELDGLLSLKNATVAIEVNGTV